MIKVLSEDITDSINVIQESTKGSKNVFIEGIFLQADVKNRNGRVYPYKTVDRAVNDYTRDYINTGRSLGELGHPEGGQINLHLASHIIQSLKPDGKNFIGRAKILETPMGNIAKTLVNEGVKLGVSLRGYGTVTEKNGSRYVGDDFTLSTVDIVADPSAPEAFVTGIMENSQKFYQEGQLLQEHFEYLQKSVNNMTKTQLSEGKILELFENFMKTIK